jgi:hypothetical protein
VLADSPHRLRRKFRYPPRLAHAVVRDRMETTLAVDKVFRPWYSRVSCLFHVSHLVSGPMDKWSTRDSVEITIYGICLIVLRALAGKLFWPTILGVVLICGILIAIFMLVVAWRTWTWRDRLDFIFSFAVIVARLTWLDVYFMQRLLMS